MLGSLRTELPPFLFKKLDLVFEKCEGRVPYAFTCIDSLRSAFSYGLLESSWPTIVLWRFE